MTERRLHLLRHAESSWSDDTLADRDRRLSGRGRRACALLAAHFATEGIAPDLVLASPARRAMETVEGVPAALFSGSTSGAESPGFVRKVT